MAFVGVDVLRGEVRMFDRVVVLVRDEGPLPEDLLADISDGFVEGLDPRLIFRCEFGQWAADIRDPRYCRTCYQWTRLLGWIQHKLLCRQDSR